MPVEEDLALMELVKESMSHIILDESPKLRSQKSFKGVSRSEPGRKARDGFTTLKSETHTPEVEDDILNAVEALQIPDIQ